MHFNENYDLMYVFVKKNEKKKKKSWVSTGTQKSVIAVFLGGFLDFSRKKIKTGRFGPGDVNGRVGFPV